ncbi:MAG: AAA family ATPase [Deltaproteobacteria bacterium]|nr:AAA family ATPase [Deltaproteobacteria bacterium]
MYNSFFQFDEQPFNLTPDPRFVYLSPGHQETLEHMLYGVNERKGFVLISGDIGTGKTTLTRLFLRRLGKETKTALIFNTSLSEIDLLRAINREFGLEADLPTREILLDTLNRFLIDQLAKSGNAVLIIDEAQNLSVSVLEQIRMLSNLETESKKLIQIILVGQPELARTLNRGDLRQLYQRITVRCHLAPMVYEDTVRYIHHRLSVAGPQGLARFGSRTYRLIHRYSQGVPRSINALCDRALLVAFARGTHLIEADHINQANAELTGGHWNPGLLSSFNRWISWKMEPILLFSLLMVLMFYWGYATFWSGL